MKRTRHHGLIPEGEGWTEDFDEQAASQRRFGYFRALTDELAERWERHCLARRDLVVQLRPGERGWRVQFGDTPPIPIVLWNRWTIDDLLGWLRDDGGFLDPKGVVAFTWSGFTVEGLTASSADHLCRHLVDTSVDRQVPLIPRDEWPGDYTTLHACRRVADSLEPYEPEEGFTRQLRLYETRDLAEFVRRHQAMVREWDEATTRGDGVTVSPEHPGNLWRGRKSKARNLGRPI